MYSKLLIFCIIGIGIIGCSDDEDPDVIRAREIGIYVDPRDGQSYKTAKYGQTEWLAENFRYAGVLATEVSVYADPEDYAANKTGSDDNLQKFGLLYTLSGALAACPDGWRLPTDEDWRELEETVGMSHAEATSREWRGSVAQSLLTIYGDSADINLRLGGYYTSNINLGRTPYRFKGAYGFYWTSTTDDSKEGEYVFYRKLIYNSRAVYRESMVGSENKLSVRYVREAR